MISEAIDRIIQLANPNILKINDRMYSDKSLHRINDELRAESSAMTSLSSLVDYIKHGIDRKCSMNYLVHIVSPIEVRLISSLDSDRSRETLVTVKAEVPEFAFNRAIEHENFLIGVQSKFVDGPEDLNDKALILKFAGTVKSGTVTEYGDDGVSQKATIKKGVASVTEALVPSPCKLVPYRTFVEVPQPKSDFIFRLSETRDGEVMCALYEADGGAWKNEAKKNIYEYLNEQLKDQDSILIVA